MSYCYLLFTTDLRQTYIGATVDPTRRLRQHNQELVGGARKTKGRSWKRALYVGGFPDWVDALQFEWSWKRHGNGKPGLAGKLQALLNLLQSEKSTSTATPFRFWPGNISIHPEPETIHIVEKFEGFRRLLTMCGRLNSNLLPFFTLPSFFLSYLSLLPTMSLPSSADLTALALQIEELSTTVAQLTARLDAALCSKTGAEAPAAPDAPGAPGAPEKKKRAPRKPKVQAVPMAPLGGDATVTTNVITTDGAVPEAAPATTVTTVATVATVTTVATVATVTAEAPGAPEKKKRAPKKPKVEALPMAPLDGETTVAATDGAVLEAPSTPKKRGPKPKKVVVPAPDGEAISTVTEAPVTPKKKRVIKKATTIAPLSVESTAVVADAPAAL